MNYVFMTDSDSDLPYSLKAKYDIPVVYMPYAIDGKEYFDDLGQTMDQHTYFDKMRAGATPVTSALNQADYMEYFEPILKEQDLLFVAFSSQLSCTIQAVYAAREELLAKYPQRKFIGVDTLSISGPMTMLLLKAHELYREGKSMEEVAQWLEENKLRAQAFFTVDDLKYLKRGGRLSTTSAVLGTMLDLKPIIVESKEGKLVPVDKVRGRKKAMSYLVDKSAENITHPEDQEVIILHADAPQDAAKLDEMLKAKVPGVRTRIECVGPVIGAHCGPGTVAICFLGKERAV